MRITAATACFILVLGCCGMRSSTGTCRLSEEIFLRSVRVQTLSDGTLFKFLLTFYPGAADVRQFVAMVGLMYTIPVSVSFYCRKLEWATLTECFCCV